MYLYRFEDGSYTQSQEGPTDEDKRAIEDGVLEVFTLVGSKFTEITPERYVDVPDRQVAITDAAITEMSEDGEFHAEVYDDNYKSPNDNHWKNDV